MGLLQKLLSTLGLRESDPGRGSESSGETTVTVEHEPDTASESAVKGTDAPAAGTTGSGSTETIADTADEEAGAAEPSEATAVTEAVPEDDEESATTGGTETESDDESGTETDTGETDDATTGSGSGESTDVLNGIGPAYAERLENAGVETVSDLAGADAADLADQTGLGEGRISNWIEQAKEY